MVITESGAIHTPRCATLTPALDAGELNTLLLIGDLGDAKIDPPVHLEVVDQILSGSGDPDESLLEMENALDFVGLSVEITPLDAGPFWVNAEIVPENYNLNLYLFDTQRLRLNGLANAA